MVYFVGASSSQAKGRTKNTLKNTRTAATSTRPSQRAGAGAERNDAEI